MEDNMSNKFEKLDVYQEAHSFVIIIYKLTSKFPKDESFGLISQIRKASVSVVANIVEGNARNHKKEFIQFLYLSNGSLEEVKYYLILSKDLGYLSTSEYDNLQVRAEKISKMINGLIRHLRKDVGSKT